MYSYLSSFSIYSYLSHIIFQYFYLNFYLNYYLSRDTFTYSKSSLLNMLELLFVTTDLMNVYI